MQINQENRIQYKFRTRISLAFESNSLPDSSSIYAWWGASFPDMINDLLNLHLRDCL